MDSSIYQTDYQFLILLFIDRILFSALNYTNYREIELDLTEISILFFESTYNVLPSSFILIPKEKGHFPKG